jgi:hypothetical protein
VLLDSKSKFIFFLNFSGTCLVGTLLVNERMLESYVIARDRFLVPNGKMFPTVGR